MDGERGRSGAHGQPVSVRGCDFHIQLSDLLSRCAFINMNVNFRDTLDLVGNKDTKGPKEIK